MGRNKKSRSKRNRDTIKSDDLSTENVEQQCYKTLQSETLGRYLVASRNLAAGEVVMTDEPLVVGPCQEAKPLCLGCYDDINLKNSNSYYRCENCSWPLCSSKCNGFHQKYGHSEEECKILSKSSIPTKEISSFEGFFYAITPLRCLIKKISSKHDWDVLSIMESHTEERKKSTELWKTNERLAVDVIRNVWGLTEFSEDEIHFVCGVLEVNAFEVNLKTRKQCLRAVYSKAFLFAHDCTPNTCRSNGQDFRLIVRTTKAIPTNEMITISYAYTLQCTLMRRRHLQKTKFFQCSCKRCSDPTELGTYIGAIKCQTCDTGYLLPHNPLDENSVWKCTARKCNNETNASQISSVLDELFKELDSIGGNDIEGYEAYLNKCRSLFHENHYLSLSAMHCLSLLYGKINGYLINDLTSEQLERKEEICRSLISIFEKLEPGLSKQKGILLYELQAPLMVLLRRRFQNMPKKELKTKVKTVLKYLNESYLILSKEPESSVESEMAAAAKEAISSLEDWLSILN